MSNTNHTVYNPNGTDPYVQIVLNDSVGGTPALPITMIYEATVSGLLMTLNPTDYHYNLGVAWLLADSPDAANNHNVIAAQDQGRPPLTPSRRLPGNGTGHTLPLASPLGGDSTQNSNAAVAGFSPIRDIRYYLSNQTAVDAYYTGNEAQNPDQDGNLFPVIGSGAIGAGCTGWGRTFNGNGLVTFFFGPASTQNSSGQYTNKTFPSTNSTPPFRLASVSDFTISNNGAVTLQAGNQSGDGYGFLAKGNAPRCNLIFDPNVSVGQQQFIATYTITDYYGLAIGSGGSTIIHASDLIPVVSNGTVLYKYYPLYPTDATHTSQINPPASMSSPLTGWFHMKVTLSPNPMPQIVTLENADDVEFGVYTNQASDPFTHPYLFDPSPAIGLYPLSGDPGISSIIGMRSVRLADNELSLPVDASPYTSPGDAGFIQHYNYLHGFSSPYSNGSPDPNALQMFGSIVQLDASYIDTVFSQYVARVVTPYAQPLPAETGYNSSHLSTPIAFCALTNEPNQSYSAFGSAPPYSSNDIHTYVNDVLKPGHDAVILAYTGTGITPAIIAPNLQGVDWANNTGIAFDWTKKFLTAGGAAYIDYFGVHTYTGNETSYEESDVPGSLHTLRTMLDTAADPNAHNKPLWITEHGWFFQSHADKPRLQASHIIRRYALAAAAGIPHEHNSYFYTTAHGFLEYYLWDGTPNRGGMALRVLAEQTSGKQFSSDLLANYPNAKYVHAIDYADANQINDTIVVWGDDFLDPAFTQSGQPATAPASQPTVTLNFTFNQPVHVLSIMGNDITPTATITGNPKTYTYTIPATSSPVYISAGHNAMTKVSGWPLLSGESNYAAQSYGGSASTSSAAETVAFFGLFNNDYHVLNDGIWQYDYQDYNKQIWVSAAQPTAASPVYVTVLFNKTRTIDTIVGVVPSSNGHVCGVRDYDIQALSQIAVEQGAKRANTNIVGQPAPSNWGTIKSVRGNTNEWVLATNFMATPCTGVRLVIYDINNGNWMADKNPLYVDALGATIFQETLPLNLPNPNGAPRPLRAMVYELEAYGASGQ